MKDSTKVLVLAELCNPAWASVPLVGWKHVYHLARLVDLELVTHQQNAEDIEKFPKDFKVSYVQVRWADRIFQWIFRNIFKSDFGSASLTFVKIPFYLLFELKVWWLYRKDLRAGKFQIVHRITPVSPVIPSPMAWFCKRYQLPFVLGPINGGLSWPEGYDSANLEREWISKFRHFYRFLPLIDLTRKHSSRILVGSYNTWNEIPKRYHDKCVYMPENGVEQEIVLNKKRSDFTKPLRVVFIGRMVRWKSPDLVFEALVDLLRSGTVSLDYIGDGVTRPDLEKRARELGVPVQFHGWIPEQSKVQEMLASYHVLAFPSIREFGGGVVVEAMAKGLVPIVMDYGGPGEIVSSETGVKLPLENRLQTIDRIREFVTKAAQDPESLVEISFAAQQRILEAFSWQKKVEKSRDIYRELT